MSDGMRELMDLVEGVIADELPPFDELFVPEGGEASLYEAWISGRYNRNIRIDAGSHLPGGDKHAHIFGRRGQEIMAIKFGGGTSHGKKGKLHQDDADALRARGFSIPASNLVEWFVVGGARQVLLG